MARCACGQPNSRRAVGQTEPLRTRKLTEPGRACRQRGFTLAEAVIVIVLTGVVLAMVGVFIRQPVNAYVDQARRAELSDAADTALRRIARELPTALPNSVRVDGTGTLLEFLPVSAGGRYRAATSSSGTGNAFDPADAAATRVDVLGPAVPVGAGDQLVLYNLGVPGADAYTGETRRALTSTGNAVSTLVYAIGAGPFPYASPGSRFQIVSTPITYACAAGAGGSGTLRRYAGYPIQGVQPASTAAAPLAALSGSGNALLADNVASCSFTYGPGASARIGLVTLTLTLSSGGESITLLHQVALGNTP